MNSAMRFVTDLNKGILGKADSEELWIEIISHIPDSVLTKKDVRILVIACGHGTEADIIVKRMLALGVHSEDIKNSIYLIDKYQVFTNPMKRKGYKNVVTGDFLEWKTNMKFDVVIGNPPYQDGSRKDQANKLWPIFVRKSYELTKKQGYVALVTPNGWMQPTADIGKGTGKGSLNIFNDIFKNNNLVVANIDSDSIREKYFKGVGSTFSYYVLQNATYSGSSTFITSEETIKIDISKIDSLPKITSKNSLSIVDKMKGIPFSFCDQNHGLNGNEGPKKEAGLKYPIYHTNKNKGTYWFGEKINPYTNNSKVIISLSGSYLPVLNDSTGFSNMCIALVCSNDDESRIAHQVLSSKLYKFWVEMQKFSGFNPRKLILKLPKVDLTRSWTDQELYQHFGLTQEEIDYIESTVK
jgi:site-specific DNA-methyltransferase (adenine-specific)